MKTTLEIPDALFRRAKVAATRRHVSFRQLVSTALERELAAQKQTDDVAPALVYDADGMPCLPERGAVISDAIIRRMREAEGI